MSDPPLSPRIRWGLIGLGSLVAAVAIGNAESCLSANDRSRWATVWSLAERGTYQIDEIDSLEVLHKPSGKRRLRFRTIDKVRHDGHFYSSKPPLFPTLVAGIYTVVHRVTGWNLIDNTETISRAILLLVNWLPWTIALVVLAGVLEHAAIRRVAGNGPGVPALRPVGVQRTMAGMLRRLPGVASQKSGADRCKGRCQKSSLLMVP